jgi:iron complex outermembrane recepter protein
MSNSKALLRGSVSAFALFATAGLAQAQQATDGAAAPAAPAQVAQAAQPSSGAAEQITVTGIRASLEKSLVTKRNADGFVDAVTAEDIGRLPDKNIADTVQRLPGVNTIQSASAGSGGFGENDRIEMRGTAPSLTQVLIDGHSVSSGDWFILDQLQAASRSVSTELFPAEMVQQVVVRKSSEADDPEGGTAGSVNLVTRSPLSFEDQYSATIQAGGVVGDAAGTPGPDMDAILNWKSDDNTFGVLLQGFYTDHYIARAGQEILGYSAIPTGGAFPTALQGASVPDILNTAYFQNDRLRRGGDFGLEWKPTSQLDVKLDGFYSYENDTNFNQSNFANIAGGGSLITNGIVPNSYSVSNGLVNSATWNPGTLPNGETYGQPGINDIYRPDAIASSYYLNLDGTYKPYANLILHANIGYTQGKSGTNQFALGTSGNAESGVSYSLNGSNPASISFPGAGSALNNPANYTAFGGNGNQDWVGFDQFAFIDSEAYGQLDAEYLFDDGVIQSVKAGVRVAEHNRNSTESEDFAGCYSAACNLSLANISAGSFPTGLFSEAGIPAPFNVNVNQNALQSEILNAINGNGGPGTSLGRFYAQAAYGFKEDTDGGYIMAKLGGSNWQGNIGIRAVTTNEDIKSYGASPENPSIPQISTSLFGPYYVNPYTNDYVDILPSAAFKFDVTKDWVVRVAASKTVSRPDYEDLAGPLNLTDSLLTGTASNPNLKPTRSANFDIGTEWYYAPESYVGLTVFDMEMSSTWDEGTQVENLLDLSLTLNRNNPLGLANPIYRNYNVVSPVNNSGHAQGFELSWQGPFDQYLPIKGFGASANFTYVEATQDTPTEGLGGRQLLGAAKDTGNITVYYQNDLGDAHIAYTRHSDIYEGLDGRGDKYFLGNGGELDAQINVNITKNFTATVRVQNLADEAENDINQHNLELATYNFGRTFWFSVTAKY